MSGTKYANAVAAIRAMENSLLTHSDIDQLIGSRSRTELEAAVSAKGSREVTLEEVWEMLRGYAPDSKELEILLFRNDFHNLKAALKAMISDRDPNGFFIRPTNLDLSELPKIIASKEYDKLPEYMRKTAADAYELLTRTLDGQLSDSLIDSAALSAMQTAAEEYGGEFIRRYVELTVVFADIKTAYRCCIMKKSEVFTEGAVCGSAGLEKEALVKAAVSGEEGFFGFLENSSYSEAARLLKEAPARFEKWCDDELMELCGSVRMQAFGIEPLEVYYIAKEAEAKDLRIITVCKESGADRETISERMRKLYV